MRNGFIHKYNPVLQFAGELTKNNDVIEHEDPIKAVCCVAMFGIVATV